MSEVGFDRASLQAAGFTGWVSFASLRADRPPSAPGNYVVYRSSLTRPTFLEASVGGWFKGRDPSVELAELERKWVEGAHVVYVGKADDLDERLGDYASFGRGNRVGHRGGRYVWQLADHAELLVAWRATPQGVSPCDVERDLIAAFADAYGKLPFANLNRGRGVPG